jgi:hypothetical protein
MKKMKTKTIAFLVIAAVVMSTAVVGMAMAAKDGQAGKSNVAHLYLYEKTGEPDWDIVEDGAWGKMKYNLAGPTFDFVFNGHELEPNTDYSLIYYKDPWPGTPATCLASGTSNKGGNINLANSIDLGMDLVDSGVEGDGTDGAKIWLVLSGDVTCGTGMTAWDLTEYLFENNGIFYEDTDD